VSVLVSEQEVPQNQLVLKLLLLLYAANNSRHLWIIRAVHNKDQLSAAGFTFFDNCSPFIQSKLSGGQVGVHNQCPL